MSAGAGGRSGHALNAGAPEPGRSVPDRVSYRVRVDVCTCQDAP